MFVSSATLQEQIYKTSQLVPRSKLSTLQALDLRLATGISFKGSMTTVGWTALVPLQFCLAERNWAPALHLMCDGNQNVVIGGI